MVRSEEQLPCSHLDFSCYEINVLQFAIRCDENESHIAVLYCITCETHLCSDCSERSHNTRTLSKHKRVPISEKPKENPKCTFHPMHMVEFTCLEDECRSNPLMCYICKDYGRHVKHKVSWCLSKARQALELAC